LLAIVLNQDLSLATTAARVDTSPVNVTLQTTAEAEEVDVEVVVVDTVDKAVTATAAANLDTFLVTALMAAAEAEVAAADMEVETVNVTDAEMSATFLGIARIPNVVAAVEMTMRPTTDKQEQDE